MKQARIVSGIDSAHWIVLAGGNAHIRQASRKSPKCVLSG
jgi:hypothetical protein